LIEAAEERLGLVFPQSYRRFLLMLGAGHVGSEEIYGVLRPNFDDSGVPDAVWATLEYRKNFGLEDAGIVIGYDGAEGFYVLDTRRKSPDESVPVLWWAPGASLRSSSVVAPDFARYLAELVADLPT
jgi:hypothetical protein